jgi:hypothetical protein
MVVVLEQKKDGGQSGFVTLIPPGQYEPMLHETPATTPVKQYWPGKQVAICDGVVQ